MFESSVFVQTIEVETEPLEDTFVVSAQSPAQQQHISEHPRDVPLFVEGGYKVWLRGQSLTYFILRADPALGRVVKEEKVEEGKFCISHTGEESQVVHSGSRQVFFLISQSASRLPNSGAFRPAYLIAES